MEKYILGIDQGTTSTRCVLVDKFGKIKYFEQMEINIYEEKDSFIYQDLNEILDSVYILIDRIIKKNKIDPKQIISIAITNQRETTCIFSKRNGKPLFKALNWQAKNTKDIVDNWSLKIDKSEVFDRTGLSFNPYFSASKIKFLLDIVKKTHDINDILVGTLDTFLLYNLTNLKAFYTDITNAQRTMLFNINNLEWDEKLLNIFEIPKSILPTVKENDFDFGYFNYNGTNILINTLIGDQQAALFGHQCFEKGQLKATYGTGVFLLANTGQELIKSKSGLISTIAWKISNKITYAVEGSIFACGVLIKWLKDNLELVDNLNNLEKMAYKSNQDELYIVPAFSGLGSPYWDNFSKASILGINQKTSKEDIVKAGLNSICFQVQDLLEVLKKDTNFDIKTMSCDGGVSNTRYVLQFQSDISQIKISKNIEKETTVLGACYISGLKSKFFNDLKQIDTFKEVDGIYYPVLSNEKKNVMYENWKLAVKATQIFKPKKSN